MSPERPENGSPGQLLKLPRQRGTRGVHMMIWKGSFTGWFVGFVLPSKRLLSCLGCSSRPITKYYLFSSPHTISLHLSPSPSKLGRQSCRVACLLIYISGRHHYLFLTYVSPERRTITTMKKPPWSLRSGKFRQFYSLNLVIIFIFRWWILNLDGSCLHWYRCSLLRSRKYFFRLRLRGVLHLNYGSGYGTSSYTNILPPLDFFFPPKFYYLRYILKITFLDYNTGTFLRGFMQNIQPWLFASVVESKIFLSASALRSCKAGSGYRYGSGSG